ncbi:MAG: SPASM domain-containing protein, partial [Candidatus Staskawiczbacteria bacterium]|nr:SPASM domain-containing protein [Candidatus Staskawiczbacteria bacterium]
PYCWAYAKKAEQFYSFDKYKKLIDSLYRYVFEVSLYDIGEPLWCENLVDYIEYAHHKRMGTSISTSLSLLKDDYYWERLVCSGLDYLIIAVDGVTQEVYGKYRRNGDLVLVMSNLNKILEARKKYKNKLYIEWQMINFDWNKHEQPLAEKIIIDNIIPVRLSAQEDRKFIRQNNCLLPYLIFIVNVYNEINPCYKYYNEFMKIGDLDKEGFQHIWNGENIACIRSRSLIKNRKICNKCRESMFF